MPLMLDNIRAEFARFLADDPHARWRMDSALAHVVTLAYERGLDDGRLGRFIPASGHSAAECSAAFEWLRTEATKEGASEHAGVALDELHALAIAQKALSTHPQGAGRDRSQADQNEVSAAKATAASLWSHFSDEAKA
jgi:hypothetical protein